MEVKWYWLLSAWAGLVLCEGFYQVLGRFPNFIESAALVVAGFLWLEWVTVPAIDADASLGSAHEQGERGGGTDAGRDGGDNARLDRVHSPLDEVLLGQGEKSDGHGKEEHASEPFSRNVSFAATVPHGASMALQV